MTNLNDSLQQILNLYRESFSTKTYTDDNNESDILMEVFGISPELKRENRQYWGRELGMCWQLLINKIAEANCKNYKPAMKIEADEPTDLFIGKDAIDTKYRIGSGDSGTLKKFKKYGELLKKQGFDPVVLILRTDNLPAAITACRVGGWNVLTGEESLKYIENKTGFDLKSFLVKLKGDLQIKRH